MLVFRTQFPISQQTDIRKVLQIGKVWIEGSPHSTLKGHLQGFTGNEDTFEASAGGESIILDSFKSEAVEIAGVKWTTSERHYEWHSTFVARKSAADFWISIDVECESKNPMPTLPSPKKPYIVKQILAGCESASDGPFLCDGKPINLEDTQIPFAANMINGKLGNSMPIVYVSSTFKSRHAINPSTLARFLYGMAHVVVEPNRQFSYRLMLDTKSQNAYGGSVGIYWPEGIGKEILFRGDLEHDSFGDSIYSLIRSALLAKRTKTDCNWNYLQQLKTQKRLSDLKESGTKNVDEYIVTFDKEIQSKDIQIEEAEKEIERLKKELYKATLKTTAQPSGTLLNRGVENDLYSGEILYHVLKAVEGSFDSSDHGTRKRDILKSILDANPQSGEHDELKDEIKSVFEKYERMSSTTRSEIETLGFTIGEEGKHYKIHFAGDSRYSITLSKTPGDHRTGPNTVRDINKMLF